LGECNFCLGPHFCIQPKFSRKRGKGRSSYIPPYFLFKGILAKNRYRISFPFSSFHKPNKVETHSSPFSPSFLDYAQHTHKIPLLSLAMLFSFPFQLPWYLQTRSSHYKHGLKQNVQKIMWTWKKYPKTLI